MLLRADPPCFNGIRLGHSFYYLENHSFASFCCYLPPGVLTGLLIFASIRWPRDFLLIEVAAVHPPIVRYHFILVGFRRSCFPDLLVHEDVARLKHCCRYQILRFFINMNVSVIESKNQFLPTNAIHAKKLNCRPYDIWLLHGQLGSGGADEINTLLPERRTGALRHVK